MPPVQWPVITKAGCHMTNSSMQIVLTLKISSPRILWTNALLTLGLKIHLHDRIPSEQPRHITIHTFRKVSSRPLVFRCMCHFCHCIFIMLLWTQSSAQHWSALTKQPQPSCIFLNLLSCNVLVRKDSEHIVYTLLNICSLMQKPDSSSMHCDADYVDNYDNNIIIPLTSVNNLFSKYSLIMLLELKRQNLDVQHQDVAVHTCISHRPLVTQSSNRLFKTNVGILLILAFYVVKGNSPSLSYQHN